MNTFRMSIEWSRIFPNSTASVDISDEGGGVSQADLEALDALANQAEVDALQRRARLPACDHDLEPLVTVNHFTLPAWVHDPITTRVLAQLGLPAPAAGWLSPDHPGRIREVRRVPRVEVRRPGRQLGGAQRTVAAGAHRVPGHTGPGSRTGRPASSGPTSRRRSSSTKPRATSAAYDAIHKWDTTSRREPAGFVGFTNNMIPARPANPVNQIDVQAAEAWNSLLQPLVPERGDRRVGRRQPRRHPDPRRDPPRVDEQGRLHGGAVLRVATDAGLRCRTDPGLPVPEGPAGAVRGGASRRAATSTSRPTPAVSARSSRSQRRTNWRTGRRRCRSGSPRTASPTRMTRSGRPTS